MIGDLIGNTKYKRKKFNEKISLKDPLLKSIYSEIIEYNPAETKVKPEKIKVQRYQIMNYLKSKFGPRFAAKVMTNFKFQTTSTFEEYVQTI